MSSRQRISELAKQLTEENSSQTTVPPTVAVADPLLELLVRDVHQHLPPEIQKLIRAAADPTDALDWIGVAILFRSFGAGVVREVFLAELGSEPNRAPLACAKAHAAQLAANPQAVTRDRLGLVLQFAVAASLLLLRWGIVAVFAPQREVSWLSMFLGSVVYLPLLASHLTVATAPFWGAALALLLSLVEVVRAPRWMERARCGPAVVVGSRPLRPGRLDAFLIAWRIQALFCAAALLSRIA